MNINLPRHLNFMKGEELLAVTTENFGSTFIVNAVEFAIRTRLRSTKTVGQARRTANAFCDGQWEVPRTQLSDIIREMPAERLARMLTNEQQQALLAAINNLPD